MQQCVPNTKDGCFMYCYCTAFSYKAQIKNALNIYIKRNVKDFIFLMSSAFQCFSISVSKESVKFDMWMFYRKLQEEREQNRKKQLSKHIPETIQGK